MIYLDNAATTRPDEDAVASAQTFLTENYFNPSARYSGGFQVSTKLKTARESLLSKVADPAKFTLIFTSGGTEGDNTAIFSGARRGNAVTTLGEHSAVYESFKELKNRGVESRFAPVNRDGSVNIDALLDLVDEKTSLVSVVHVNNETGAINDIAEIAKRVKEKNPRTLVHSDGVQAFGKLAFRLTPETDLYSVSAHKIGGLKGAGALILKKNLKLTPLLFGGGQEDGLRSGTENVFGIMAFHYAAERRYASLKANGERLMGIREKFYLALDGEIFTRISPEGGSPYILTVSAAGMRGEVLQRMLWERGVAVGTGSACSSKHPHSRILEACGYQKPVLDGVLRVSFAPETKEEDALLAADAMNKAAREFKGKL